VTALTTGWFVGALMERGSGCSRRSLFMRCFSTRARRRSTSPSARRTLGKIVPVHLAELGGEGFIMQRLQGDGWAFVHAGGMLTERTLARRDNPRRYRLHPSRSSQPWIRTFSSWQISRPCSAARVCSSRHCGTGSNMAPVVAPQPAGGPDVAAAPQTGRAVRKRGPFSAGSATSFDGDNFLDKKGSGPRITRIMQMGRIKDFLNAPFARNSRNSRQTLALKPGLLPDVTGV